MTPPTHDPETPTPGIPYLLEVCRCTGCGRVLTGRESVRQGCGPSCREKGRGGLVYQRLEARGQLRLFGEEARP